MAARCCVDNRADWSCATTFLLWSNLKTWELTQTHYWRFNREKRSFIQRCQIEEVKETTIEEWVRQSDRQKKQVTDQVRWNKKRLRYKNKTSPVTNADEEEVCHDQSRHNSRHSVAPSPMICWAPLDKNNLTTETRKTSSSDGAF